MATYSTGTPPTNALKLNTLQDIFNSLADNTSGSIVPKNFRDGFYTVWENIMFKPTTAGGTEYIGIDKSDFREKIFLGKKTVNNQFIMNNNLLSSDVDIFFYNTKTEPQLNYNTKIAFLAGTGSHIVNGNIVAPYIESQRTTGFSLDFNIVNPSYYTSGSMSLGGNININSQNGNIVLNNVVWPTSNSNLNSSQDGYVLKYKWIGGTPYAIWETMASQSVTSITSAGTVSISGGSVLISGINYNFSSNVPMPNAVGGIPAGTTFSNMPLAQIINLMLYPYIRPTLTTNITPENIEAGDTSSISSVKLNYTITRSSTYSITSLAVSPSYTGTIVNPSTIGISSPFTGFVTPQMTSLINLSSTQSHKSLTWSMSLVDSRGSTASSQSIINVVTPWYYGTATVSCTQSSGIGNINNILGTSSTPIQFRLTPLLTTPALTASSIYNKTVTLQGNGVYIYFGYPSTFPDLTSIIDQTGNNIISSFYKYTISGITSPHSPSRWSNKTYKFYVYVGSTPGATAPLLTTLGSFPSYSSTYQFKFV
jgi:hypothetical protein